MFFWHFPLIYILITITTNHLQKQKISNYTVVSSAIKSQRITKQFLHLKTELFELSCFSLEILRVLKVGSNKKKVSVECFVDRRGRQGGRKHSNDVPLENFESADPGFISFT